MHKIYSRPRIKLPKISIKGVPPEVLKKRRKVVEIIVVLIIAFSVVKLVLDAVLPIFNTLCENRAKSIATIISNEQATIVMTEHSYDELFTIEKDNNTTVNELKTMSDLLKKERDSISNFTRDQGFSERYSASKAKGENTLSGMLNKMNNAQYEKVLLNAYDIETSKSMQQVADISFQAVMKQINLSDSEVWQVCQNQLIKIKNLQKELDKTKEELRLANYQIAENNLKKEAKKRGDDI